MKQVRVIFLFLLLAGCWNVSVCRAGAAFYQTSSKSDIKCKPTVVERYRTTYTEGNMPLLSHPNEETYGESGDFIRISYVTSGSRPQLSFPIEIRLSYWFDINRTYPAYFYEDMELDKFGHTHVGDIATTDDYKGTIVKTNVVRRTRADLNPFDIFVPAGVDMFAENEDAPCRKRVIGTDIIRDDTLFVFADIYKNGQCISEGIHYLRYFRFQKKEKEECLHFSVDTLKVWNVKREEISPTEIMVTYDVRLKCKNCGYEFENLNMMRTDFVEEKEFPKYCPPHIWNPVPEVFIGNRTITLANGKKLCVQDFTLMRQCLCCIVKEPVEGSTVYSVPIRCSDEKCPPHSWNVTQRTVNKALPPKNGCNRQMEITHYDGYCPLCGTQQKDLFEPTEKVSWDCCPPHEWQDIANSERVTGKVQHKYHHEILFTRQRKCTRCGLIETYNARDKRGHTYKLIGHKCEKIHPIKPEVDSVPFRMNLVINDVDSSAFYIGETEVTQQLWNAVLPKDSHGWKKDSKMPATEVTYEEVQTFIAALNRKTAENGTPLQYRLPTEEEWKAAYRAGGTHIPSDNINVQPVAKTPADSLHCFDMFGNASEMVDSCITTTDEYGEQTKWQATMGGSGRLYDVYPYEIKWENFSGGGLMNVGFRLVADYTPLLDENGNIRSDVEPPYIEEEVEAVGPKGLRFIKVPIYLCETCGKEKRGVFVVRMKAYGVTAVTADCDARLE